MHIFLRNIIVIIFCIYLYGCSATPDELIKADQLMENAPDSALNILQHIKQNRLIVPSDKALYALLMSQALEKNGVKVESDSLISIATQYYDKKDPEHAGYAWYYLARCANNIGDANQEATALNKSQEFALETGNYKLMGLVYCEKGDMYLSQLQVDSAIYLYERAYQSFKKIHNDRNSIICLINAGNACLYLSRFDSTILYLKSAEKIANHSNDTIILSTIYRSLGTAFMQLKKFNQALHYFYLVPLTYIPIYDSNKYCLLANVFVKSNQPDSARYYLNKVNDLQKMAPDYYHLWQTLYENEGNSIKALYYAKLVNSSSDSLNNKKLKVSFAGLEKKYKFERIKQSNEELIIKDKQNSINFLIILFAFSFCIIIMLFRRNKEKSKILNIKNQLFEHERELNKKEKENIVLLEKQIKLRNILLLNIDEFRKQILKHLSNSKEKDSKKEPILNLTFQKEIIACVDIDYNDISIRLKERFTDLTERDILICCLLISDFDTGMIASVLGLRNDSVTTQRYRIRTKLKIQKSDNLIDFLLSI